jgi:hypothetical protein
MDATANIIERAYDGQMRKWTVVASDQGETLLHTTDTPSTQCWIMIEIEDHLPFLVEALPGCEHQVGDVTFRAESSGGNSRWIAATT